jgi:RNA polymerase sigma-70 factor, ECF subfamily
VRGVSKNHFVVAKVFSFDNDRIARWPIFLGSFERGGSMATNLFSPTGDGGGASRCREPEEGQLLALAKSGQAAAFAELCRAYAKKILRAAYRITKNQEDAEDAVQDSFLKAFLHLEHFEGRSSFSTWLTRITINSALMILRRRRNSSEIPVEDSVDSGTVGRCQRIADSAPDPEKHYLAQERERLVQRAIRSLRPNIRGVLEMHHFQDYSVEEIVRVMGISLGAVKLRLFRARKALRRALSPRNIADSKFMARRTTTGSRTGDA